MRKLLTCTLVPMLSGILVLSSCVRTDEVDNVKPKIPNEDLELITLLGYDLAGLQVDDDSYLVEGDVRLTHEYLKEIKQQIDADTVKTRQSFSGLAHRISPANQPNIIVDLSDISENNDWQDAFFMIANEWCMDPYNNLWSTTGSSGTNILKVSKLTGKPNVFMECTPPLQGKPGTVKINLSYSGASDLNWLKKQMHAIHALGHALGLGHSQVNTSPDYNYTYVFIEGTKQTDTRSVMRIHPLDCDEYRGLSYDDELGMRYLYPLLPGNMVINGPSSAIQGNPQPYEFWVNPFYDYQKVIWSAPGMTITSTPNDRNEISATFSERGNITIQAVVFHVGGIARDTVTKTISVNHGLFISGPTSPIKYDEVEFTVNVPSGTSVTWNIPNFTVTSGSGTNTVRGIFTSSGTKTITATTRDSGGQVTLSYDVDVVSAELSGPATGVSDESITFQVINCPSALSDLTWEFKLNNTVIPNTQATNNRASATPNSSGILAVKVTLRDPNNVVPEVELQTTAAILPMYLEIDGMDDSSYTGREIPFIIYGNGETLEDEPGFDITWSFKLNGQTIPHNNLNHYTATVTPQQTGTLTASATISHVANAFPPMIIEMDHEIDILPRKSTTVNIFDQHYFVWNVEYPVIAIPSRDAIIDIDVIRDDDMRDPFRTIELRKDSNAQWWIKFVSDFSSEPEISYFPILLTLQLRTSSGNRTIQYNKSVVLRDSHLYPHYVPTLSIISGQPLEQFKPITLRWDNVPPENCIITGTIYDAANNGLWDIFRDYSNPGTEFTIVLPYAGNYTIYATLASSTGAVYYAPAKHLSLAPANAWIEGPASLTLGETGVYTLHTSSCSPVSWYGTLTEWLPVSYLTWEVPNGIEVIEKTSTTISLRQMQNTHSSITLSHRTFPWINSQYIYDLPPQYNYHISKNITFYPSITPPPPPPPPVVDSVSFKIILSGSHYAGYTGTPSYMYYFSGAKDLQPAYWEPETWVWEYAYKGNNGIYDDSDFQPVPYSSTNFENFIEILLPESANYFAIRATRTTRNGTHTAYYYHNE